jgi:hypothetical protein
MATSRAFDLALFVGAPANLHDGVVVSALGPPFQAQFQPMVVGGAPGISVGASMPAASASNQIMVSGVGPSFAWGLASNPAVAATVPAPTAINQTLLSDATLTWKDITLNAMLAQGGCVVTNQGATFAFDNATVLTFAAASVMLTRLNGLDPTKSALDNFSIDAGTY